MCRVFDAPSRFPSPREGRRGRQHRSASERSSSSARSESQARAPALASPAPGRPRQRQRRCRSGDVVPREFVQNLTRDWWRLCGQVRPEQGSSSKEACVSAVPTPGSDLATHSADLERRKSAEMRTRSGGTVGPVSPRLDSILGSSTIGTGLSKLVTPCGRGPRPAAPAAVGQGTTFGLTLSGGGFRATLAALGAMRYLADAKILANLRYVSSVSGGSIANGVLARHWPAVRAAGFTTEALDHYVIEPVIAEICSSSMKTEILRNSWRVLGPATRTDLLIAALDRRFFEGQTLESLDPQCRFVFNAANLVTGVRFGFERDVFGDYVLGLASTAGTNLRVATAVAASAAVPGAFAPVVLPDAPFPCGGVDATRLLDGGAYDNTGLEALDSARYRAVFLMTMNAGGVFVTGPAAGRIPIVRDLARANSLLYRQSTGLRTRWTVDRFRAWEAAVERGEEPPSWARRGVLVSLATTVRGAEDWRLRYPEHRTWKGRDLAFVPTVFDKLDRRLCRLLVYRGWWLIGAVMSRYYPDLLELRSPPPLLD